MLDFTLCWTQGKAPINSYNLISPSNTELSIEIANSDHVQNMCLSLFSRGCDKIMTKATEERSDMCLTISAYSPSWQGSHGGSSLRELVASLLSLLAKIKCRNGRVSSTINNKNSELMACTLVFRLPSPFCAMQTLQPMEWPRLRLKRAFTHQ